MPTVSVIIPAYNAERTITQAVESVLAQTYDDYEIIAVDDGSADGTWAELQRLASSIPALRILRTEHRGLAAARNRAVSVMTGEWIAPLDADDVWRPGKLQRCMEFLARHPQVSVVYTPMDVMDAQGRPMERHRKPCHAGQLTRKLFSSIFIHDPAVVFHKRVIESVGPFDESLPVAVGHEFWLRVSMRFEIALIDEPLAVRRWSTTSATRSNRSRARIHRAAMLERFYFEKGGKELIPRREAMRRLSRVHYAAGKVLLKEGRPREANCYLSKALAYNRLNFKAWALVLPARAAQLFTRPR
jgi:glycosyltransferase involved in cell wall biosynthesis